MKDSWTAWQNAFRLPFICFFRYYEKYHQGNSEIGFTECHRDSTNFKQAWSALTALAILFIPLCAS